MNPLFRHRDEDRGASAHRVPARHRKAGRIACWSLAGTLAGALAWTTAFGPGPAGAGGGSDTVAIAAATASQDPAPVPMEQIVAAGDSVFALASDHQAVYEWSSGQDNWQKIGGAAKGLYAGGDAVYATDPGTGDVSRYGGEPGEWTRVGGPGAAFAASTTHLTGASDMTTEQLYGISPDRSGVWQYSGQGDTWTRIGGPAAGLYTPPAASFRIAVDAIESGRKLKDRTKRGVLFATDPATGDISKYDGEPGEWTRIGGPGAAFAVTDENLYGLTPDRSAVVEYDVDGKKWKRVGGPAGTILASNTLYATSPGTGDLYKYNGRPDRWNRVSGPAAAFATSGDHLYRLAPDHRSVQRYDGSGADDKWATLGAPAAGPAPTAAEKSARYMLLSGSGAAGREAFKAAREKHLSGVPDPYEFRWSTNYCNSPAPNNPLGFSFTDACIRHDFGYRNYRDMYGEDAFRADSEGKKRVDGVFQEDMEDICRTKYSSFEDACVVVAGWYATGVGSFG